jgi:hypothetical protein
MAALAVPMRTLQEWMGYRDFTTTLIYADFRARPERRRGVRRARVRRLAVEVGPIDNPAREGSSAEDDEQ